MFTVHLHILHLIFCIIYKTRDLLVNHYKILSVLWLSRIFFVVIIIFMSLIFPHVFAVPPLWNISGEEGTVVIRCDERLWNTFRSLHSCRRYIYIYRYIWKRSDKGTKYFDNCEPFLISLSRFSLKNSHCCY